MAKIRIDQSHCNHHLSKFLTQQNWEVIFKDAGRVSRGGAGIQGKMLRIFEENSFPIPDIVAHINNELLIVEIDSSYSKVANSLERYRKNENFILSETSKSIQQEISLTSLTLNYCKMGSTPPANIDNHISKLPSEIVDQLTIFEVPRTPIITCL